MTATATETDILAALDYDEECECEHPHHHTHVAHDTGPATYWAITTHACYGPVGIPYPVCSAYAAEWASPPRSVNRPCTWCPSKDIPANAVRILRPIKAA